MTFWEKVKKDLQRDIKEGIAKAKEGAMAVRKKTVVLSEEASKQYRIFALKSKVHNEVNELGGKVYALSAKAGNPLRDGSVKTIVSRIRKLEAQIHRLERKGDEPRKRKTPKPLRRPKAKQQPGTRGGAR